jgi:hypothetical protein
VAKILTGLTFWIALLLIMTLGGELFTGNLMYVSLARLHGRCTTRQMLVNWGIVFWGNFAACVLGAYVLAFQGDLYASEPWRSYVQAVAMHKVELSWGAVVCRGIGANWMVCAVRYVTMTAIFLLFRYPTPSLRLSPLPGDVSRGGVAGPGVPHRVLLPAHLPLRPRGL